MITGDQKCGSLIVEEGSKVTGKCEIIGTDKTESEIEIPELVIEETEDKETEI